MVLHHIQSNLVQAELILLSHILFGKLHSFGTLRLQVIDQRCILSFNCSLIWILKLLIVYVCHITIPIIIVDELTVILWLKFFPFFIRIHFHHSC